MATPTTVELAFAHWQYEEERERQAQIVRVRNYHAGEQDTYLTPRLREFLNVGGGDDDDFNLNIMRGVVEAVTERMIVEGFKCLDERSARWAAQVWSEQRLDAKQDTVHTAATRDSASYLLLGWDAQAQAVQFIPHERYTDPEAGGTGEGCKITYANDDPNQPMLFASKRWVEALGEGKARQRLTLYYPERIEKYVMAGSWVPLPIEADGDPAWPLPWVDGSGQPIGIPMIEFANMDDHPEAEDAIPLQNGINKTLIDILAASDSSAFRIFKAFGFYPTTDGQPPADDESNWLTLSPGQIVGDVKTDGSFDAIEGADPAPLVNVLQQLIYYVAIVTRTPMSRYQFTGQVAAEGTLKQQNESLLAKVDRKMCRFGDAWEDVMLRARHLQNVFGGGVDGSLLDETQRFETIWRNPEKRDRLQELQALQIEKDSLGVPLQMLWQKAGYKPDEIEQMMAYREEEMAMNLRVASSDLSAPVTDQMPQYLEVTNALQK
jgi:Phage portal protein, SPP1 Gp6-like